MHSGMIGIWDQDPEYAKALCEYLRRQEGLGAFVVAYEDRESLRQAVETGQIWLVITGESESHHPWLQTVPLLILTEQKNNGHALDTERNGMSKEAIPRCYEYRYQSARQIRLRLEELKERAISCPVQKHGESSPGMVMARIRGIYAPLGGCLKTSLGLVLGSVLAEEKRCLLVSLEAHAGFRTLFGRQYPVDLADLLAAIRQGGDWQGLLSQALQPFGKLQYIPPVIWPVDIREAEFDELEQLLRQLALCGRFDEILVDVGQDLARPEKILTLCDWIYQPHKEDVFSKAKLAEYDCYLQVAGYEALRKRTHRIALPQRDVLEAGMVSDQWQCWEELLPLARQVLQKEGSWNG